jgi:hypothetical protein
VSASVIIREEGGLAGVPSAAESVAVAIAVEVAVAVAIAVAVEVTIALAKIVGRQEEQL